MEKRARLRFPRGFLSSLTSCRTQNLLSDVIHNHNHQNPDVVLSSEIPFSSASLEPLLPPPPDSPVRHSYASICRPRCPQSFDHMVRQNCILSGQRKKLCGPVSPLNPYLKLEKPRRKKSRRSEPLSSDWFSSDDEREDDDREEAETETETLFSSSRSFISLSSSDPDSIGSSTRRRRPPSALRREARNRKKRAEEGSFAVVKRSSDPYSDFRTSMVEMIMEKQIFGAKELHQLLNCFLSLNPPNHHRIILEVFAEICDALFSNFC